MGALRAGKWGLTAGIVLALTASGSIFMLSRSGERAKRLRLVGDSKALSKSGRLLATTSGKLRCMSPSSDGKIIRVVWGDPARSEQIDVQSGAVTRWNILPETFQRGCPVLSPDGRRLAFAVGEESRQIMMSLAGDGSAPAPVTTGWDPQWLPTGQELIYRIDNRRVALISPGSRPNVLAEASAADETFMVAAIDSRATQLAIVYDGPRYEDSLVVVHELPSLRILEKYRTPVWANSATYGSSAGQIYFTGPTAEGFRLFSVRKGHQFERRVHHSGWDIYPAVADGSGLWLGLQHTSASLIAPTGHGEEREITRGRDFTQLAFSSQGYAAAQEVLEDGSTIIGLYDPHEQRYTRLTDGTSDTEPLFDSTGSRLAYISWADRRIHLCRVKKPHACRVVFQGEEAWWLAGFSPSGSRLAFFSGTPSGARLRAVDADRGTTFDLGYTSTRRCPARWVSEDRLWIFREDPEPYWSEIDLKAQRPTGQTEPASDARLGGCPASAETRAPHPLRAIRKSAAAVWRYDLDR